MERDRDCGGSTLDSFARLDRGSSSWKTSMPCGHRDETRKGKRSSRHRSEPFLEKWPSSGSMRNGRAYRRPTLGQPNDGVGCSFWPTATAASYGSSQNGINSSRPSAGTASLPTLASNWPTPCTTDAKDTARSTTSTGVMHPGTTSTGAIRAWCTRHRQTMGKVGPDGSGPAVLHPEFVEALMGLPEGWTRVDDADASDALVGLLLPGRQQRLF